MTDRLEFYQQHLNRVSRSFAFCIERLETPLRAHVSLAYLLCRILDSVEDALWPSRDEQLAQFARFDLFLQGQVTDDEVRDWVARFPPGLPEGELLLLPETGSILRDIHRLPLGERQAIIEPVQTMSRGMRHFAAGKRDGVLRLRSLTEVNQYCFFVAGVVGEILTRLIAFLGERSPVLSDGTLRRAYHFGLFLQKINLLKDQRQDEDSGRFLVPSRATVMASLHENVSLAIEYVLALPETFVSYRLFCGWSLSLGLASLPWIEKAWQERSLEKIPRGQTQELLARVEAVAGDNRKLRALFDFLLKASPLAACAAAPVDWAGVNDFPELYRGLLPQALRREFGLPPGDWQPQALDERLVSG